MFQRSTTDLHLTLIWKLSDIIGIHARVLLDPARTIYEYWGSTDEKHNGRSPDAVFLIKEILLEKQFQGQGIGLRVVDAMMGCVEAFPKLKGRDFEIFLSCPRVEHDKESRPLHEDKALVPIKSPTRQAFPGLKERQFGIFFPYPRVEPDDESWFLQEHKALVLIESPERADLVAFGLDDYTRVDRKLKSYWSRKGFFYMGSQWRSDLGVRHMLWAIERRVLRAKMEGLVL